MIRLVIYGAFSVYLVYVDQLFLAGFCACLAVDVAMELTVGESAWWRKGRREKEVRRVA